MLIERTVINQLQEKAAHSRVLIVTGALGSGKTTAVRTVFPKYAYVPFDDIAIRSTAQQNPEVFLEVLRNNVVFDEIAFTPRLLVHIAARLMQDENWRCVLVSSVLLEYDDSLFGADAAIIPMSPFSVGELSDAGRLLPSMGEVLVSGFFPGRYAETASPPADFFDAYIRDYVERSVHCLKHISNTDRFFRFVAQCARLCGDFLNITTLAERCCITRRTAEIWLEILEKSYVIFLLRPYHKNFGKRLVKSPRLYFWDTGLVCRLAGISSAAALSTYDGRDNLFRNFVVMELVKRRIAGGKRAELFYFRESNGLEADALEEDESGDLYAYQIEPTETESIADRTPKMSKYLRIPVSDTAIIYGGEKFRPSSDSSGALMSWKLL